MTCGNVSRIILYEMRQEGYTLLKGVQDGADGIACKRHKHEMWEETYKGLQNARSASFIVSRTSEECDLGANEFITAELRDREFHFPLHQMDLL